MKRLKDLAKGDTPTRVIDVAVCRTTDAGYKQAAEENISLNLTSRSPYKPQKKGWAIVPVEKQ